jgi:hypothetical protein
MKKGEKSLKGEKGAKGTEPTARSRLKTVDHHLATSREELQLILPEANAAMKKKAFGTLITIGLASDKIQELLKECDYRDEAARLASPVRRIKRRTGT